MWRGFDLSGNQAVVQGGMDIALENITLSYWGNMQLVDNDRDGLNSGDVTESDLVIDYSTDLNDMLSLSVGNILYDVDGFYTTNELYVSLGLATILEPAVTVYYDYDECKADGLFATLSVGHGIDLSDKAALSLGALVSFNQASDFAVGTHRDMHNYELSAGLDVALSDTLSAGASMLYSEGISHAAKRLIDSEISGGVSLAYAF